MATDAAMRVAAWRLRGMQSIGAIVCFDKGHVFNMATLIDDESGLPELIAALEWYVENDDTNETPENQAWLIGKRNAIIALRIACEGRKKQQAKDVIQQLLMDKEKPND